MSERSNADTASRNLPKSLEVPQWVEALLTDPTPVHYFNEDDDMVEHPIGERVRELIEQKKVTLQKLLKMMYRGLPALALKDADLDLPVWTPAVTKLTGAQSSLQELVESHPQWFPSDLDGVHDRMGMGLTIEDLEEWENRSLPDTIKELLIELWNGMTPAIEAQTVAEERVKLLESLTNGLQGSLVKLSKPIKEIHPYPFRKKLGREEFFKTFPTGEDVLVELASYQGQELVYLGGEPPDAPVVIRVKQSIEDTDERLIPIPNDLRYPEEFLKPVYQPPAINDFPHIPQREFLFKSFDERVDDKRIRLCKIAGHNDYAVVIDTDIEDKSAVPTHERATIFLDAHLGAQQCEVTFQYILSWAEEQRLTAKELAKKTRERLRTMTLDYTRSRFLANALATA